MDDARDPSFNVPPGLLEHVHLISSHRFPPSHQPLPLDTITDYLLSAPQILRDRAAVSWQYIRPPPNGTIFLAWQPTSQLQDTFATDGYLWPAPEARFIQDSKNYKTEIFLADSGYIYGSEQVASHRRVRYRLIASPTGEPVDSNLEIIHYTQAPRDKHVPVGQLPSNPHQARLLKSRQYLENAGSLERKEFMFSDRTHWPKITMPGQRTPSMGGGFPPRPGGGPPGPAMGRGMGPGPSMYPPSAGVRPGMNPNLSQPSSRRQRGPGVAGMPRPPGMNVPSGVDPEMMDEDIPSLYGDYLDQITPNEISRMRYKQHHEWMEEVLTSPYATNRILPATVDYLESLQGELRDLTTGLVKAGTEHDANKPPEVDIEELERRVNDFEKKGRHEIERMKHEHQKKIEELRMSKFWTEVGDRMNSSFDSLDDSVDNIVSDVEAKLGGRIVTREEVKMVQKGGLLSKEELAAMNQGQGGKEAVQPQDEFNEFTNIDSAGEALDFYSAGFDDSGMTFENT